MSQAMYRNTKLNEFRDRLQPIHIKNLKRLQKTYQEDIAHLLEYSLVITEELERRKEGNRK